MNINRSKGSDNENKDFVIPEKTLDQKPGLDKEVLRDEDESEKNIRYRTSELSDIPQLSLAERVKERLMKRMD